MRKDIILSLFIFILLFFVTLLLLPYTQKLLVSSKVQTILYEQCQKESRNNNCECFISTIMKDLKDEELSEIFIKNRTNERLSEISMIIR